ncbi:MAG: NUDIX domain-containing protein, partial [Candidatus Omnitrophota bacterium]
MFCRFPDHPNWTQLAGLLNEKYKNGLSVRGIDGVKKIYFNDNEYKAGDKNERLRGPADFWKKEIKTGDFTEDALKDLGGEFPHVFGIDLGAFAALVKAAGGIAVLAHPVEDRNYWVKVGKYKEDTAGEKVNKLTEVFKAIAGKYPEVKDNLWGVEVYSSKHSPEEVKVFEGFAEQLRDMYGKSQFIMTIGSDAHYNNYETEKSLEMGSGKKNNLREINSAKAGIELNTMMDISGERIMPLNKEPNMLSADEIINIAVTNENLYVKLLRALKRESLLTERLNRLSEAKIGGRGFIGDIMRRIERDGDYKVKTIVLLGSFIRFPDYKDLDINVIVEGDNKKEQWSEPFVVTFADGEKLECTVFITGDKKIAEDNPWYARSIYGKAFIIYGENVFNGVRPLEAVWRAALKETLKEAETKGKRKNLHRRISALLIQYRLDHKKEDFEEAQRLWLVLKYRADWQAMQGIRKAALKEGSRISKVLQGAYTKDQATMFNLQIDSSTYHADTYVEAIADPKPKGGLYSFGRAFGNGLANLGLLSAGFRQLVQDLEPGVYNLRDLMEDNFWVGLHGGGTSARNPTGTQIGKFKKLSAIPSIDKPGEPATLEEILMVQAETLASIFPAGRGGYINKFGDDNVTFDAKEMRKFLEAHPRRQEEAVVLVKKVSFPQVVNYGAAAIDEENKLLEFVEKYTKGEALSEEARKAKLAERKLLVEGEYILMNTAIAVLGVATMVRWLKLAGHEMKYDGTFEIKEKGKAPYSKDSLMHRIMRYGGELDTFGHLFPVKAVKAEAMDIIFGESTKAFKDALDKLVKENADYSRLAVYHIKFLGLKESFLRDRMNIKDVGVIIDELIEEAEKDYITTQDSRQKEQIKTAVIALGRTRVHQMLWEVLKHPGHGSMAWVAPVDGKWLDTGMTTGEAEIILTEVIDESKGDVEARKQELEELRYVFGIEPRIGSIGGARAYASLVEAKEGSVIAEDAMQIAAHLSGKVNIGAQSEVFLMDWPGELTLSKRSVISEGAIKVKIQVRGREKEEELIMHPVWGIPDVPKDSDKHTGRSLKDWFKGLGIAAEEIWPGIKEAKKQNIMTARIFPAVSEKAVETLGKEGIDELDKEIVQALPQIWEWLQLHTMSPPEAWLKALKAGRLFSISDTYEHPSPELFQKRREQVRAALISYKSKWLVKNIHTVTQDELKDVLDLLRSYLKGFRGLKQSDVDDVIAGIEQDVQGIQQQKLKGLKKTRYVKKLKGELADVVDENDNPVVVTEAGFTHIFGWRPRTANAFILSPKGQLVIQRRVHNKAEAKKLSIFGGHVTAGQSYDEAVRREILEELSLDEFERELQGKLIVIGVEGQFQNDSPDNNEFRSLYAYILTEAEYRHILNRKDYIDSERAKRTIDEFEEWLEAQQLNKGGYGEVWSYLEIDPKALEDKKSVLIEEEYREGKITEEVGFTSDLLLPIVTGQVSLREGTPDINPMKEIGRIFNNDWESKDTKVVILLNSQHGGGKSKLSRIISRKTGFPIFSAGNKKREFADAQKMTINDFNAYLEEHEAERAEIDRIIDAAQEEAIKQGNVIIESSLGVYLARGLEGELEKRGIKSAGIFIKADLQVRAQRVREGILVRKDRSAEVSTDVEVIANDLSIRDEA